MTRMFVALSPFALGVALVLLVSSTGQAQDNIELTTADRAYEAGDLTAALRHYEQLLILGHHPLPVHRHILERLMVLRSARRDEEGTRRAAAHWFATGADQVPAELSSTARRWLDEVRAATVPFDVTSSGETFRRGDVEILPLDITSPRPGIGLLVLVGEMSVAETVVIARQGRSTLEVPLTTRLLERATLRVRFIDEHDNEVLVRELEVAPTVVADPVEDSQPDVPEEPEPPLQPRDGTGSTLAIFGGVTAGIGAASLAVFLTLTLVGWDAFQTCTTPDCESHLDWTPELADASAAVALGGGVLLVVGLVLDAQNATTDSDDETEALPEGRSP